jgi:hypothetical protein
MLGLGPDLQLPYMSTSVVPNVEDVQLKTAQDRNLRGAVRESGYWRQQGMCCLGFDSE